MTIYELEDAVTKLSLAFTIRNSCIGRDLIAYLSSQFTLDEVAAIALLSLERLVWMDTKACLWAVEYIIPEEVKLQVERLVGIHLCQQLLRTS